MDIFWEEEIALKIISLIREVYRMETTRVVPLHFTLPQISNGERTFIVHNFVYTFVPSHDSTGHVDGVIVYAVDETEQLQQDAKA
jgi:hypothetical protein